MMDVKIKFYRKGSERPIIVTDTVENYKEYMKLCKDLLMLQEKKAISSLEFFDDIANIDFENIDFVMIGKPVEANIDFDFGGHNEEHIKPEPIEGSDEETEEEIEDEEDDTEEESAATTSAGSVPVHEGKSEKEDDMPMEIPYKKEDDVFYQTLEEVQELIHDGQENEKDKNTDKKEGD